MPLPSAEKEGLPAPLASSSLALLGSNPRNKKRQKHLFPCSCLLRRKRDCSLRSRARRWRSSVRTPATKKGKSTYSHALAFCGERGIARSARELVAGTPRFEPPQQKKAKALIPMPLPSAEKEGLLAPLASSSLALLGSNPRNKKSKSNYSHALAFCGERGIARSARELVAGAPRFEPPQ